MRTNLPSLLLILLLLIPLFTGHNVYGKNSDLDCFKFHKGDSPGYDIERAEGNLAQIARKCLDDHLCIAFNANGWLKYELNPMPEANARGWYERICLTDQRSSCKQRYDNCRDIHDCDQLFEQDWEDEESEFLAQICNECESLLKDPSCETFGGKKPKDSDSQEKEGSSKKQESSTKQEWSLKNICQKEYEECRISLDCDNPDLEDEELEMCKDCESHLSNPKCQAFGGIDSSKQSFWFKEVDKLISTESENDFASTKTQAFTYLKDIASWFGVSGKDSKKIFHPLVLKVNADKCSSSEATRNLVAKAVKDRGFPKGSALDHCKQVHRLITGLYELASKK